MRNRLFQLHEIGSLRLLAEQDGHPERVLKSHLEPVLAGYTMISAAYLIRIEDLNSFSQGVALFVVTQSQLNETFAAAVGEVFSSVFSAPAHMDIVSVTPDQEIELARVGKPFYIGGG